MKREVVRLFIYFFVVSILVVQFNNCASQESGSTGSPLKRTSVDDGPGTKPPNKKSALSISPSDVSISTSTTQKFKVTGGVGPYTFTLSPNFGSISASGEYTAPTFAGTATVSVKDKNGLKGTAIVRVNLAGSGLSISPSSITLLPGDSQTFTATGGTKEYEFSYEEKSPGGKGTFKVNPDKISAEYIAPTEKLEWTKVRVKDAAGNSATAEVKISVPSVHGEIESVTRQGDESILIKGWACIANSERLLDVHIYGKGPFGQGIFLTSVLADKVSGTNAKNACPGRTANSGFEFVVSKDDFNNKGLASQQVWAYGINSFDTTGGSNTILLNSGAVVFPPAIGQPPVVKNLEGFLDENPNSGRRPNGEFVGMGWACLTNDTRIINVEMFVEGVSVAKVAADLISDIPGVDSKCGGTNNHGFRMVIGVDVVKQHLGKPVTIKAFHPDNGGATEIGMNASVNFKNFPETVPQEVKRGPVFQFVSKFSPKIHYYSLNSAPKLDYVFEKAVFNSFLDGNFAGSVELVLCYVSKSDLYFISKTNCSDPVQSSQSGQRVESLGFINQGQIGNTAQVFRWDHALSGDSMLGFTSPDASHPSGKPLGFIEMP